MLCGEEAILILHVGRIGGYLRVPSGHECLVEEQIISKDICECAPIGIGALDIVFKSYHLPLEPVLCEIRCGGPEASHRLCGMNRLRGVDADQPDIGRPIQLHLDGVSVDYSGDEHHSLCTTLGSNLSTTLGSTLSPALGTTLGPALRSKLGPALRSNLSAALGTTLGSNLSTTLGSNLGPALGPALRSKLGPGLVVTLRIGSAGAVRLGTGLQEGFCGVIPARRSDQGQTETDGG